MAHYNQRLLNRFAIDTAVAMHVLSERRWPMLVRPEHFVAYPLVPDVISITVGLPPSRTLPIDVEQVIAVASVQSEVFTATAHLVTMASRRQFTDVQEGFWADDPLQYLAALGVVSGYADGSFRPNDNVTRAQFAKMLIGAMGWTVDAPATPTFRDVSADFWAYAYIEAAAAHGVISGYADGTFRPASFVTRAQLAKMIVSAYDWPTDVVQAERSFTDVSADDWLYVYAQLMSKAEVTSGYSDGTFRPYAYATRAQIVKILTLSLYSNPGE